jgi:uncharacterized membrane protein
VDAKVPRLDMVDLLRGFVIALMVLDHTRDYFHVSAYTLGVSLLCLLAFQRLRGVLARVLLA